MIDRDTCSTCCLIRILKRCQNEELQGQAPVYAEGYQLTGETTELARYEFVFHF